MGDSVSAGAGAIGSSLITGLFTNTANLTTKLVGTQNEQSTTATQSASATEGVSETSSTGTTTNSTTGSQTTVNNNTVVNSSDPAVVAALKSLANEALSNSSNAAGNTSGVVSGIFQSALDSLSSVFGQQAQSGVYNSQSTGVQESNAAARATADAASAVLGYQTQQEGIASGALTSLLSALGTQTTQGTSTTTSNSLSTQISNLLSETLNASVTQGTQTTQGTQDVQYQSTQKQQHGMSVVCTYMRSTGEMHYDNYIIIQDHYNNHYSDHGRKAYLFWAAPLVKQLRRHPKSKLSIFIKKLFSTRTDYVCNKLTGFPVLNNKEKRIGFISYWFVHIMCIPPGLIYLMNNLSKKYSKQFIGQKSGVK